MKRRMAKAACGIIAGLYLLTLAGGAAGSAQDLASQTVDLTNIKKIAVLTHSYSSEYWGYAVQGCKAYDQSDTDIVIEVQEPSGSIAADEQIVMLQSDLESGRFDGFVIAAIDRSRVEAILSNVDVPVIAINSPLSGACVIGGIGTDNETAAAAGGKKAAEMAKTLGWEKPECVMISGFETEYNNENRTKGFRSGIEKAEGVWLDAVYPTDKSGDGAREAMRQIMKDYPDGIAVVACYNDLLASNALEEAVDNPAFANTVFLGFDGNGTICERIMNDERYVNMVTVAQNPYEMGFHAVEQMSQYLLMQEQQAQIKEDAAAREDGTDPSGEGTDRSGGRGSEALSGEGEPDSGPADGSSEAEPDSWIDSGYAVITSANAQERMLQIKSHLS